MKKILFVVLLFAVSATPALANDMWYWADETGTELTDVIDAAPGETVRVWAIARTNMAGWPPLNRVRQELWWDTAVIDNWSSGDPAVTITPFYYDDMGTPGDPADDMVSDLCAGNYGAAEDYNFPAYNHYGKVDLWATIYVYGGMRIVGFDIPVRTDAPLGLTSLGAGFLGTDYWSGGVILSERIESDDDVFGLRINVTLGGRLGDFDGDGDIDADDIDALGAAVQAGSLDLAFDMDGNGLVEQADFDLHVTTLVDTLIGEGSGTMFGDFNLDGVVDLIDLGMVGDEYGLGTGWATGDSNGDGAVDLIDLGAVGDNYGFVATAPIPEPATMTLLALGGIALIRRKK